MEQIFERVEDSKGKREGSPNGANNFARWA